MQTEEIQQQNKLIADFMGYYHSAGKFYSKGGGRGTWFQEAKYDCSWDWLMPVVQKIINADMDTFDSYVLWVSDSLRTADIKQVYTAVCNYLESRNRPPVS